MECLTDETADVETADDWKATLPDLTGVWATDVVAIAESQLGYTESTANFTLAEDGVTRKGYTRYGAWAGNEYGDWAAMFASFCLRYAGVSQEDFPEATGAYAWSVTLSEVGLYEGAEDGTPLPGDLVFLDADGDGTIDTVGIVTEVDEDGGSLTVIEGDYATADGDVVAENTYALSSSAIVGYGLLPEQESQTAAASEEADDTDSDGIGDSDDSDSSGDSGSAEEGEPTSSATVDPPMGGNLLTAASVDPEENLIATASEEGGSNALSTSTDLEEFVTGVSIKVLDGNSWVDVTADSNGNLSVEEGDSVQVTLSYSVSDGMTGKTLTYTIPSYLAPSEEVTDGVIYDSNGKAAGTYTITQNASGEWILTLTYDDSYETTSAFSGTVTWTGTATVVTEGTDVSTMIGTTTIKIVADKTTSDLSVDKTADYSNLSVSSDGISMGYISYEVTASTTLGTDGTVTITDTLTDSRNQFGQSWPGSWYDTSSLVLYVYDSSGNIVDTIDLSEYTVTYTNNYNSETDEALAEYLAKGGTASYKPTLTISGLPELAAGYSYVLDYDVNVNIARNNADGTKTISNTVTASDTSNNGEDSTSKAVQSRVISKSGSYNAETNTITWTITVNSDGSYNLDGFQLGDVLDTDSNTLVGEITITSAVTGDSITIDASDFFVTASQYQSGESGYTFSTDDWTETQLNGKFTITYTTAVDSASSSVKNQAFIYTKDVYWGVTSTPGVGRGSLSKTYDASASTTTIGGATYSWKITETVPTGKTSETLKDTITQAVGTNGSDTVTLDGSHYALLSTLWSEIQANLKVTIQLQGVTDAKSTTLTYNQFLAAGGKVSVVYYDESGNIVTDSDAHVTSFAITVDTSNCTYYSTSDPGSTCYLYKIELVYSTIADFSNAQAGYTYTVSNEAESSVKNAAPIASVTYTPAGTIKKYAKTSTSTDYTEDNQTYELGSGDDCIYYRLELTTGVSMNDDIVITDYLPEGVTLVTDTDPVVEVLVGTDTYNGVTYTTAAQSDGTTLLTITIPAGYNSSLVSGAAEGNTLYVYYVVSIASDAYWDDAANASKTYINTASWGGLTADTDVTVTRDTSQLGKTGSATATPNSDGTYDVAYRLLVNPGAEDLSDTSDEIILTDTLNTNGATATLDYTSVKLYYYYYDYETYGDYTSSTSYGSVNLDDLTEVGSSLWSYSYDSATNTVTFTLPDEMAFLLVYTYQVDIGNQQSVSVSNTVVSGTVTSSEKTVTITTGGSGASVSQGKVVVSKQDSTNAGILLKGAEFTLYAYDTDNKTWVATPVTLITDANGQIELVVSESQTEYFVSDTDTSSVHVKPDTLYRLEETSAPNGYAVADEVYYIIFTGDNKSNETAYTTATGLTNSSSSITPTVPGGTTTEEITISDITFGSLTNSLSVIVGDEPTTITAVKNWYNSSNVALTDEEIEKVAPKGVQLQLYQVKYVDGTEYETVAYEEPVTVSANNNWTATWENLPKTGTEVGVTYTYTYYVQEVTQGNYVTTYTNNGGITSGTIGVINKVDYVDVSVNKVWVGDEDDTSDRPSEVTVVLKANGTECDRQKLNDGNSWAYTWANLDKYSGGAEIEYTIEEVEVKYYVSEVTGDAATGFTVTNTYIERYNLPSTGGAGAWAYSVVGFAFCGGILLVLYKRRRSS